MKWFLIFGLMCMLAGAYFVFIFGAAEQYANSSNLFIVLLATPSYYFFCKSIGLKKGIILLLLLSILAIFLETFAILTSFPYGSFEYSNSLGYKLFGITPWTVCFGFVPLFIGTISLIRPSQKYGTFYCAFFLMAVDLVIDPGSVRLGFWSYLNGGEFFAVPLSNFIGWLFSGFIFSSIYLFLLKFLKISNQSDAKSGISLILGLFFWTSINFLYGLFVPAGIGLTVLIWVLFFSNFSLNFSN